MSVKVGVLGATGRMGSTVCAAVLEDPALELVAAVDAATSAAESSLPERVLVGSEVSVFSDAGAEVVVDFTVAAASRDNLPLLAQAGIHVVVGTTGFSSDDFEAFAAAFTSSNCVIAANFAISAVLMMRFAEMAAPFFETAEIVEYHHNEKLDAPSGTAVATAHRMAAASSDWVDDPTRTETIVGARGGVGPGGIRVHSVRMKGMIAHQEVVLGAEGQALTIRQDSFDRSSFMPGVLLACKRVADYPGLTIGLDAILGIAEA